LAALGVAILGCGDIAQRAHLPAWQAEGRARITYVVDRDAQLARRVARDWSIPNWSTDYRAALASSLVQAVDVCMPVTMHRPAVVDALAAARHVLVEKPLALSLDDAEAIADACARTGSVLMVAENWVYSTAYRAAAEAVGAGAIGQPFMLHASHHSDVRLRRPLGSEKGDRDHAGYLFVTGTHVVTVARELMGPIEEICGYAGIPATSPNGIPLDDDFVAILRFASSAIGSLDMSGRSQHVGAQRLPVRVLGDEGLVEFDVLAGWTQVTSRTGARRSLPRSPSVGFVEEIKHFVDCIETGAEPRTGLVSQIGTLAAIVGAYRSLETGAPVRPADLLRGKRGRPEVAQQPVSLGRVEE
jgi:predicted dehydrogenase